MPIRQPTLETTYVRYHASASSFLAACQNDLVKRERDANILYPLALKIAKSEPTPSPTTRRRPTITLPPNDSDTSDSDSDSEIMTSPTFARTDDQFWLSVWTTHHGRPTAQLDIALSCTNGPIGKYPVFLYANHPDDALTKDFVVPRVQLLVKRLRSCLASKRVFSVFGPDPLTNAFVPIWSDATCHIPVQDPYYAAKHTFCTRATLTPPTYAIPEGHELRLADASDLIRGAELCYGFAAGSEPFVLSCEDAIKEARGYIANRQMYVYNITNANSGVVETASIVCVTRTSPNVAAITKVYTNPHHRGQKCAEKLVRYVCNQMLVGGGVREMVLFVAHDNAAAEKVYDRVGFQGLCGKPRPEGVNDWVEIGFEDTEVGHW